MRTRVIPALFVATTLAACGGGSPTKPSGPGNGGGGGGSANRNPTIASITISPGFGVSQLNSINIQASASDPDGDQVTYDWDLGDGTSASGASVTKAYSGNGGTVTVRLTAKDGKGGSATDTRSVVIGSMTGRWIVDISNFTQLQLDLTQNKGTITGTFVQLGDVATSPAGTTGKTDPAEPGKIDANGKVEIRFKIGRFLDFYLRGTMDQTGRQITGGVYNSGFNGTPFTATKQ